jgi:hypothetical protein
MIFIIPVIICYSICVVLAGGITQLYFEKNPNTTREEDDKITNVASLFGPITLIFWILFGCYRLLCNVIYLCGEIPDVIHILRRANQIEKLKRKQEQVDQLMKEISELRPLGELK